MTDTITPTDAHVLTAEHTGPECYVRINVTKNTKGYSYETTISLRWESRCETTLNGEPFLVVTPDLDDEDALEQPARDVLARLNQMADSAAREEISRRQAIDDAA